MSPPPVTPRTSRTDRRKPGRAVLNVRSPSRHAAGRTGTCGRTARNGCTWNVITVPAPAVGGVFSPLDEELALLPGEFTPLLHERLVDVGTHIPSFARGARVCRRFTGTTVSAATLRRYTERAGQALCDHETTAAAAPAVPTGAPGPQTPLWVLVDGVFVRLLHSEWREVKSLAIGEVQPPQVVKGEEVVECGALSYFSRLLDVDAFIPAATGEIRRRGVDRAEAVGAASDGASWCQRFFDHHCPQAVR